MKKKTIKPRYKMLSEEIIKCYNDPLVSSEEIEAYFTRAYRGFKKARKLTGGRISGVYQLEGPIQASVIKSSKGIYRMLELQREAEVLNYIKDTELKHLVPSIRNFRKFDHFAYIVLDYFDGETVREKLSKSRSVEDRQITWEVAGTALAKIHTLCKSEDVGGNWLREQLKLASMNMEKGFIDLDDFGGKNPKEVLEWLASIRPERTETTLLHGDFRTKNIMVDQDQNCKIIDWGFMDVGDPYYDLAVIDYYFADALDRKSFYKGYGSHTYDKGLIDYYDRLSWFINV